MSQSPNSSPPVDASADARTDTADYPHRIENHVKIYLQLEETESRPVGAAPDTARSGTRVCHRHPSWGWRYGTVADWTDDGRGAFVHFDDGSTNSWPIFDDLEIDYSEVGGSGPRWVVSAVSVDGYPLDGVEDGHYCDYEGHPPGARPDWDRQHREAENMDLPTAEELLPLLAEALGTGLEGPTVDQLRSASDLIAEHAEWRSGRADLSAGESAGDFPASSDWQESDDAGCDLADRAVVLLAELTGQQVSDEHEHVASVVQPAIEVATAGMDAETRLRRRPEPPALGHSSPPTGPVR